MHYDFNKKLQAIKMKVGDQVNIFLDSIALSYNIFAVCLFIFIIDLVFISLQIPFTFYFILFILQLSLYAGCWGSIIDIINSRNTTFSSRVLLKNLMDYFWLPLAETLLVIFVFFLTSNFFIEQMQDSLFNFRYFLFPVLIPLNLIIISKLKRIDNVKFNEQGSFFILIMLTLTGLYWTALFSLSTFDDTAIDIKKGVILTARYIEFLLAIYWSKNLIRPDNIYSNKDLYLIAPQLGGVLSGLILAQEKTHPAVFSLLKSLTPQEYIITIFNFVPVFPWQFKSGKLVAIMGYTQNIHMTYSIAKKFRARGSKVVIGGAHVTSLPEEALEYCDSVVVGPVENVWTTIIDDYEKDSLQKIYQGNLEESVFEATGEKMLSLPANELIDCLEMTRGCKFKCEFCVGSSLSENCIYKRSPQQFRKFIEKAVSCFPMLIFLDSNIYADPSHTKSVLSSLKGLKFKWCASSSLDIAYDDEILKLLKQTGCHYLTFGYEIFEDSAESRKGGKFSLVKSYRKFTQKIKRAGIYVRANLMFGFDNDSWLDILKLWKFSFSIFPLITAVSIVVPFPGSPLFERLKKEDRILDVCWRNYHVQGIVFEHNNLKGPFTNLILPFIHLFISLTASYIGVLVLYSLALIFFAL